MGWFTPGMRTSEFWGKFIVQLMGLLVLLGVIDPAQVDRLAPVVPLVAGTLALVVPEIAYAISRGLAKQGNQTTGP